MGGEEVGAPGSRGSFKGGAAAGVWRHRRGATAHKGSHCFEFPQREKSSGWVGEEVLGFKPCRSWGEVGWAGGWKDGWVSKERGRRNGEENEDEMERERVANCTFSKINTSNPLLPPSHLHARTHAQRDCTSVALFLSFFLCGSFPCMNIYAAAKRYKVAFRCRRNSVVHAEDCCRFVSSAPTPLRSGLWGLYTSSRGHLRSFQNGSVLMEWGIRGVEKKIQNKRWQRNCRRGSGLCCLGLTYLCGPPTTWTKDENCSLSSGEKEKSK